MKIYNKQDLLDLIVLDYNLDKNLINYKKYNYLIEDNIGILFKTKNINRGFINKKTIYKNKKYFPSWKDFFRKSVTNSFLYKNKITINFIILEKLNEKIIDNEIKYMAYLIKLKNGEEKILVLKGFLPYSIIEEISNKSLSRGMNKKSYYINKIKLKKEDIENL